MFIQISAGGCFLAIIKESMKTAGATPQQKDAKANFAIPQKDSHLDVPLDEWRQLAEEENIDSSL